LVEESVRSLGKPPVGKDSARGQFATLEVFDNTSPQILASIQMTGELIVGYRTPRFASFQGLSAASVGTE